MSVFRIGSVVDANAVIGQVESVPSPFHKWSWRFRAAKRAVDVTTAVAAMPIFIGVALVLLVLNPVANRGPLFFRQERMGFNGKRFKLWKFRTMTVEEEGGRGHEDPVETHRITPLGRILRKLRIDEIPNFINVLTGDMSLVGPRPDAWEHAAAYRTTVPYYGERFRVRPGITGLAQVRGGYADTAQAVVRKARLDNYYVSKSSARLEAYVIFRTFRVMATGFGAK